MFSKFSCDTQVLLLTSLITVPLRVKREEWRLKNLYTNGHRVHCHIFLATNTFSWNSIFAMTLLANSMTVLLVNGRPIFPCLIQKSQMIGSTSSINGFSNGLVAVTFFLLTLLLTVSKLIELVVSPAFSSSSYTILFNVPTGTQLSVLFAFSLSSLYNMAQ